MIHLLQGHCYHCVVLDSGFVYVASVHHRVKYINYFPLFHIPDALAFGALQSSGETTPPKAGHFLEDSEVSARSMAHIQANQSTVYIPPVTSFIQLSHTKGQVPGT